MNKTLTWILLCASSALTTALPAQHTERVSLSSTGASAARDAFQPDVTPDGRYVVFVSDDPNLVPNDTNFNYDVFRRDRVTGTTERVSVDFTGAELQGWSFDPVIDPSGRKVLFRTNAMVSNGSVYHDTILLKDMKVGTIEIINYSSDPAGANGDSFDAEMTPDALYFVFTSEATNLGVVDGNGVLADIYLRDRPNATTEIVSVSNSGTQVLANSSAPDITPDARYVVFQCDGALDPADTNGVADIYLRDRVNGTTERISLGNQGQEANGNCLEPHISDDGRYVVFYSEASNLVPGDTNQVVDVFLRDRVMGTTIRISQAWWGGAADGGSSAPRISGDGRFVMFMSEASNIVPMDSNAVSDIFVFDRLYGFAMMASVGDASQQGDQGCWPSAMSANGRFIVFPSAATNLEPGPSNGAYQVYLRDRLATDLAVVGERAGGGPPQAGVVNEARVLNATPGDQVWLAVGAGAGSTPAPACGLSWDILSPKTVRLTADRAGIARIQSRVPASYAGRSLLIQALDVKTCRITPAELVNL